ncbi:amidohydrolase family protein [Microbacterium aurantiacum]|uniref:amidohydrolase family protein n=1 Tax=Microbacterium aurantiacum TaxID=162393 RepID=UPI00342CCBC1
MSSIFTFDNALIGPDLEPVTDAWMAVDDGMISAVGSGRPPAPAAVHRRGFAIPGLIDCHVHLALDGGSDIQAQALAQNRSTGEQLVRRQAPHHLDSGVTTVRDLGSPGNVVLDLIGGCGILDTGSPRIVAAGAVGSATGHGSFLATPAETLDDYVAALDALAERGARAVKVFASGGVITAGTTPGATQMAPELISAVVAAAHERGLRVAAHAHGLDSIRNAIAAGVDTVEHFSYLSPDELAPLAVGTTTLVTTYVATERFVSAPDRAGSNAQALAKILDHDPHERAALGLAVAAGARLAVGTDAGTTLNRHGGGMQEQALHLAAAGLASRGVLRALTVGGAAAVGVAAGALAPGLSADLVCLRNDPLGDLTALREVEAVMLAGAWVRG